MTIDLYELPLRRSFTAAEVDALWRLADRQARGAGRDLADIRDTMLSRGGPAMAVRQLAARLVSSICWFDGRVSCPALHLPTERRHLPNPPLPGDLAGTSPAEWFGRVPVPLRYAMLPAARAELWSRAVHGVDPAAVDWHREVSLVLARRVKDRTVAVDPMLSLEGVA